MNKESNVIVAIVSDLYFVSRIEAAAAKYETDIRWLESASQCEEFTDYLLEHQPKLVLVDLNMGHLPWKKWITAAKKNENTRNLPVVMYGSHTNVELIKSAKETGADQVVAKSRFVTILPDLMKKYVSVEER